MDRKLELALLAFDAANDDPTDPDKRALFEAHLDQIAEMSGAGREKIRSAIRIRYSVWKKAQNKPTTLPAKA